ncbi:hypothetical protein GCM10023165_47250 [Variovorax defluvii]|uniref:RHS protein conserved region domain-containing protein n=1 Tax=Variovorax defluvii TaxID=913761 RepID=A0ABP8IBA4_9BURK
MSAPTLTSQAPSVAFSFFRTVAIVLFIIGAAGAIEAMPTSGSVPGTPATASLTQTLKDFFSRLWSPGVSDAETLGTVYLYGEDGSLLSEVGTGGANSGGTVNYIYLPTANGPMPIAAEINGQLYAVHSDHLNTPRRLTDSQGQVAWQWAYSAFGDEKPTIAANRFANPDINPNPGTTSIAPIEFNLRYQNHYADKESGLFENRSRFYHPPSGRYTQGDGYGLNAGPNRFIYALGDPLGVFDDDGLEPKKPSGAAPAPFSPLTGGTIKASPVPGWQPVQIGVLSGARPGSGGLPAGPQAMGGPSCSPGALHAAQETTTVIGRVRDLNDLEAGEKSLLDRLPSLGNPKANWQQNAGVLREEMRRGLPIRDASPGDTAGQFLNAERNLLRDRGWTFDSKTSFWTPPKQ